MFSYVTPSHNHPLRLKKSIKTCNMHTKNLPHISQHRRGYLLPVSHNNGVSKETRACFRGEIHERVCFTAARGLRDASLWQRQSDRRVKRTLGTEGGFVVSDQRQALGPLACLAPQTLGQGTAWSTSTLKPSRNVRRSRAERETFMQFGQSRGRFVLPGAWYCVLFTLNWRIFLSLFQSSPKDLVVHDMACFLSLPNRFSICCFFLRSPNSRQSTINCPLFTISKKYSPHSDRWDKKRHLKGIVTDYAKKNELE